MRRVGIIILAAGSSSRLGRPKQLLEFQGHSLIRRAAETALASVCRPVIVVLGAYAESVQAQMKNIPVTLIHNPHWELGMGSSIKAGLEAMTVCETTHNLQIDAALLMLTDQPFISSGVLNELAESYSRHGGIVAAAYNNTLGVPAVFGKDFNQELISLPPTHGAKCLIERHPEKVHAVDFPEGAIDIDTADDYEQLVKPQLRR
jgi:molybdenum cofactor cytidylyltransferase